MAAYHRVYDSRHLHADCQEPGSAPEPYAQQSSMGHLYLFTFLTFGLLTASTSGAGKGEGEEGHAPRAALQRTASGGAKIWNSEI